MSTIVSGSASPPERQSALLSRLFLLDAAAGRVLTVNSDGSGLATVIEEGRKVPDGLAIDVAAGHLYWTNMGNPKANDGTILRSDFDGTNLTTIVPAGGTFTPKQLQIETSSGKLYWCDREGMRVMRSNLDGSSIETLVDTSRGDLSPGADATKWCVGIAVDMEKGKFYWTQKGGDNAGQGSILRASITMPQGQTAADRRDIELVYEGLPEPIDLDIDPGARMLYWTDRGDPPLGNTVNRAPLDAAAGKRRAPQIVLDHLMEGIGLALDPKGGRMFVTDLGGSIYSADLDGTNRKTLQSALGNLTGIAYVDAPAIQAIPGPSPPVSPTGRGTVSAAPGSVRPANKASGGAGSNRLKETKQLPKPNSDFYQLVDVLTDEEKAVVRKVRAYMESKVQPIINKYWSEDAFPFELLESFKELGLGGLGFEGYGCAGGTQKLFGLVAMEMARVDASFCTFFGVHSGLAMGSIYLDGSEEQKRKWLPPMARLEKVGCFGLTEPLVGSGTSGGMTTTAKREGDTWILNGQKRWIGNAPWCDVSIIWARDIADNQVKGFIVENKTTPGFSVEKIEHKIALKVVQNGEITLKEVRIPEANRLQGGNSFRDTARVLRMTRYMVGWASTGVQMGAFEATLKYTQERLQFGKPIASFQMVQDLLAKMLANVTACQCLMMRLAQLDDEGRLTDHQAALAKAFCSAKSRETVAWGRELLGGNGIVADYNVARFFADAEALYSYEGTYQMQNLIVGKAITGIGAFV